MALHHSEKRDQYPSNPQPYGFTSKVIAEFVDEIPKPKQNKLKKVRTHIFEAQEGVKEALEKAMQHRGKAMCLVEYVVGPPSRRRDQAKLRAMSLNKMGYSEANGWIVRAVDEKVFVVWTGELE